MNYESTIKREYDLNIILIIVIMTLKTVLRLITRNRHFRVAPGIARHLKLVPCLSQLSPISLLEWSVIVTLGWTCLLRVSGISESL